MQIEIVYDDGTKETVNAWLKADTVLQGKHWRPGIRIASPQRCYFGPDYFEGVVNETEDRSGREVPDAHERGRFEAFSWSLVGDEKTEARALLGIWAFRLGAFDPSAEAANHDHLSDEEQDSFEHDQDCWNHYLEDPAATLAELLVEIEAAKAPAPR